MPRQEAPLRHDPREEAAWFERLPTHAQEEFRERWRGELGKEGEWKQRRRRILVRYLAEGAGLFELHAIFFASLSFGRFFELAGLGILLGAAAFLLHADRTRYVLLAFPAFVVAYGFEFLRDLAQAGIKSVSALVIFLCLALLVGYGHEMARQDGHE